MPTRARLDEFIATVVSGDHAGAIERYYTEDATMQENAAAPRVGRDLLVSQERATLERVQNVMSTCVSVIHEGDRVAINWVFDFTYHSGRTPGSTKSRCRNGAAIASFASGSSTTRRRRPDDTY